MAPCIYTKRCDRPWMRARWRNECSSSSRSGGESTQWKSTTNSIITEAPQAAVVTGMVGIRHLVLATRFLPLRLSPMTAPTCLSVWYQSSTPREAKGMVPLIGGRKKKDQEEAAPTRYELLLTINYCCILDFGSRLLRVGKKWVTKGN